MARRREPRRAPLPAKLLVAQQEHRDTAVCIGLAVLLATLSVLGVAQLLRSHAALPPPATEGAVAAPAIDETLVSWAPAPLPTVAAAPEEAALLGGVVEQQLAPWVAEGGRRLRVPALLGAMRAAEAAEDWLMAVHLTGGCLLYHLSPAAKGTHAFNIKASLYDLQLRSALQLLRGSGGPPPGDAIFLLSTLSTGWADVHAPQHQQPNNSSCVAQSEAREYPTVCVAPGARVARRRCGAAVLGMSRARAFPCTVLVPHPYFGNLTLWQQQLEELSTAAEAAPWATRRPQAFFRGACGHHRAPAWPRVELVELHRHADALEVSFVAGKECKPLYVKRWGLDSRVAKAVCMLPAKPKLPLAALAQYKYLLHPPGQLAGAYSRHLSMSMALGGVPLVLKQPFQEFFSPLLQPGVHFVELKSTRHLLKAVEQLHAQEQEAERMGAAAALFAHEHFSATALASYWQRLLTSYAAAQKLDAAQHEEALDAADRQLCTCEDLSPNSPAQVLSAQLRFSLEECPFCSYNKPP